VIGLRASAAVIAIRDGGLELRIRFVTSSEPAGTVIRQSPAEDTEAVRGTEVVLVVAKNRPVVRRVEVPDVVGTTVDAARRLLRSAGFHCDGGERSLRGADQTGRRTVTGRGGRASRGCNGDSACLVRNGAG
jgi:beta-lactam-binding protein with PASTA domain